MKSRLAETERRDDRLRGAESGQGGPGFLKNIITAIPCAWNPAGRRPGRPRRSTSSSRWRRTRWQARIHMLTEMEKLYEGYSKAVKLVMGEAGAASCRGVHGPWRASSMCRTSTPSPSRSRSAPPCRTWWWSGRRTARTPFSTSSARDAGRHLPAPHLHPPQRVPGQGRGKRGRLCGHGRPAH